MATCCKAKGSESESGFQKHGKGGRTSTVVPIRARQQCKHREKYKKIHCQAVTV